MLDEVIAHYEEMADYDYYNDEQMKRAEDYRQLAEWLKELKLYRQMRGKED